MSKNVNYQECLILSLQPKDMSKRLPREGIEHSSQKCSLSATDLQGARRCTSFLLYTFISSPTLPVFLSI